MNDYANDAQYQQWNKAYAGDNYYYGTEPGPLARRTVRYHRPGSAAGSPIPNGCTALDAGCGEGQDLAFLATAGYQATGIEFTAEGAAKTRRFLQERGLTADVQARDLRAYTFDRQFDLVLAVNALQFLGGAAPHCLAALLGTVAPGGVLGLSLFAREADAPALHNGVFYLSLPELMAYFSQGDHQWQFLEAAQLWQWNARTVLPNEQPLAFVTLIARRL